MWNPCHWRPVDVCHSGPATAWAAAPVRPAHAGGRAKPPEATTASRQSRRILIPGRWQHAVPKRDYSPIQMGSKRPMKTALKMWRATPEPPKARNRFTCWSTDARVALI